MGAVRKVGITLHRIGVLTGGHIGKVLEMARLADAAGIDMISVPDHIGFGPGAREEYPQGPDRFPGGMDEDWYEPLTLLAAIASVTTRIQLSTAILISPLRSAVFLAKQLATLDRISGGRIVPVFGAGWHRAEFASCNMPFDTRFTHMEEQIDACRTLWKGGAQSFHGTIVNFDDLWSHPLPVRGDIPIWLGIKPSTRNTERMVRYGDGWLPAMESLEVIADTKARVLRRKQELGLPASFTIRKGLVPVYGADGRPDADATFAQAEAMVDAGVDVVDLAPIFLSDDYADAARSIERLAALKG